MPTSGPAIAASIKSQMQGVVTPTAVKGLLLSKLAERGFKIVETPDGKKWMDDFLQALSESIAETLVELTPTPLGNGIYQQLVLLSDGPQAFPGGPSATHQ